MFESKAKKLQIVKIRGDPIIIRKKDKEMLRLAYVSGRGVSSWLVMFGNSKSIQIKDSQVKEIWIDDKKVLEN